jgi:type IV secretory pathway TraG/TraD family ATPase VirD4
MSPQDFMEMDDGELVCFIGKKKPFRLKSMDWRRHPVLKQRLGITPPALTPLPPLDEDQPESPAQKPPPLQSWHYDPQLFRKWPQIMADNGGTGENLREHEEVNEVSLGL